MSKKWVTWVSIAAAIAGIIFGIVGVFEHSYAEALVRQVERHETAIAENTRAVAELTGEFRAFRDWIMKGGNR